MSAPRSPGFAASRWAPLRSLAALAATLGALTGFAQLGLVSARPASAAPAGDTRFSLKGGLADKPVCFIPNRGQVDEQVAYYLHGRDSSVGFRSDGVLFALSKAEGKASQPHRPRRDERLKRLSPPAPSVRKRHVVKLEFPGARHVRPAAEERAKTVVSYLTSGLGRRAAGLPTYRRVVYRDLWPGIDLSYGGTGRKLKYEFVVHPGADPGQIRLRYRGAAGVKLDAKGGLVVSTPLGPLVERRPETFEDVGGRRVAVESAFVVDSSERGEVRFDVGDYDRSHTLVIDPVVFIFAGFIGGDGDDSGTGIALNTGLESYVTGVTDSFEDTFPDGDGFGSLPGAVQTAPGGLNDVFVVKVAFDGSGFEYATFLGGDDEDFALGIAVDSAGNAYVGGYTASDETTFPDGDGFGAIPGAVQLFQFGIGTYDAFVVKLSNDGSSLLYATYVGGDDDDGGFAIAVDGDGAAYLAGQTFSTEATFPDGDGFGAIPGANQSLDGPFDGYVVKLSPAGTSFEYATFIGGDGSDDVSGIAVDSSEAAYFTGSTSSDETTFPDGDGFGVLPGFDQTFNGGVDGFAGKLNASGTSFVYASYLGGLDLDFGDSVAVDGSGGAVAAGTVTSDETAFPDGDGFGAIPGADQTWNGGLDDAYVVKFNAAGTSLDYATYIGGADTDHSPYVALDGSGAAYAHGCTDSDESTFPDGDGVGTLEGADLTQNGNTDNFVVKVAADGSSLEWVSFVGGDGDDCAGGIAVDPIGEVFITGDTDSTQTTFPDGDGFSGLPGPDQTQNGFVDAFVVQLCYETPTLARLTSFTATEYQGGTLLQWTTGYEVDNLGFHLYAQRSGQRVRLTPSLIAGTALTTVGGHKPATAGSSYAWWTDNASGEALWLEDVDLSGRSRWHGPIYPAPGGLYQPRMAQAALLAGVNAAAGEGPGSYSGPFWRTASVDGGGSALGLAGAAGGRNGRSRGPRKQPAATAGTVKLLVRHEGWFRVDAGQLIGAGLPAGTDPRNLHLYVDGAEVPIYVAGESDGRLDPVDIVYFYGLGLDTSFTDTHTYWLSPESSPGARMGSAKTKGKATSWKGTPYTLERKDRIVHFAALLNGDESNWFGPVLRNDAVNQPFQVKDLAAGSNGMLEVALQGVSEAAGDTPDHRVEVFVNGTSVGEMVFDGRERKVTSGPFPGNLLREGENVVTLQPKNGNADISVLDFVRFTYLRKFQAENNRLRFMAPAGQKVTVKGFTQKAVEVLDITDPRQPLRVQGKMAKLKGQFNLTVGVPGSGNRLLLAVPAAEAPDGMLAEQPTTWAGAGNSADLVIVAHSSLANEAAQLAQLRRGQGLATALVDVQDVYDEFSYGTKTPQALRSFVQATQGWSTKPKSLLLFGRASLDPRNYLGTGDADLVPTKELPATLLETASDDWFADFNEDGVPELGVGRLPARSAAEAAVYLTKLQSYESTRGQDWRTRALLVAGTGRDVKFNTFNRVVRGKLSGFAVQEIDAERIGAGAATAQLAAAVQSGQLVVNYAGHGSVDLWLGNLLTSGSAATLTNGPRMPLVVSMTCLNGKFHDVTRESLGTALLGAPQGGAIAVFASAGLTESRAQLSLDAALFSRLFTQSPTLGDAARAAKAAVGNRDVRRTWILLGDPTLRIR